MPISDPSRSPICWLGRLLPGLLLGLLLALVSLAVQAQYQWRDKAGQMHVSDLPPPADVPEANVLKRPGARVARSAAAAGLPASAASRAGVDPEIEARRARAEQTDKARAKAEEDRLAEQRAENCQRARAQIGSLESGQRLARVNAQGERVLLDDRARADEVDVARRVMASDCR